MIPGSANPLLLKSAAGGLQIERSLRFNSSDSAYCTRAFAAAPTTRTKGSISFWVKRAALGSDQWIFDCYDGSSSASSNLKFRSDNAFEFQYGGGAAYSLITTQVFRDASAWYHFVFILDSTLATTSDRVKMYVNGVRITNFSTANYPAQNANHLFTINTASNRIGCRQDVGGGTFLSAYLANFHWIDGLAVTDAGAFTETDATTGQLIPKTYSGSYGANGFNLLFADNSSNTASTLGKDTSGLNNNNWTPNNLSVTAGAGNDSLVDSPTNYGTDTGVGGEVRGNYATWNPLALVYNTPSLSNGNLDSASNNSVCISTIGIPPTGKWYCEVSGTDVTGGICPVPRTVAIEYNLGSGVTGVIGIAVNRDADEIKLYKNNVLQSTTNITSGGISTSTTAFIQSYGGGTLNAGQRAFAYTAPSGFKALCTQNLPEGTITTSGTYTGNGAADGPFVYLNGVPTAMTVGVNAVTFGTDADKLSNGFKLRTTNVLYNQNALSYSYSITTTGAKFKYARAQPNP
jgi:hypothetical protein